MLNLEYNRFMKIAILGYGIEGKSIEKYFKGNNITIFDHFSPTDLPNLPLKNFDLVFRSPSVQIPLSFFKKQNITDKQPEQNITDKQPEQNITDKQPKQNTNILEQLEVAPQLPANWTSSARYFFDHCPAQIIGVTGTKGKGTTCSLINAIFKQLGYHTHLVGNIGNPALDQLNQIQKTDIVIFELSSFQLWDLKKSPHISVVLRIEPDHLDVHHGFTDYVAAKSHIAAFQHPDDTCIFYQHNQYSTAIASLTCGKKIPYSLNLANTASTTNTAQNKATSTTGATPVTNTQESPSIPQLYHTLDNLSIPGAHNRENAIAAILAVSSFLRMTPQDFIEEYQQDLTLALKNFKGLPHRLQFIRSLNQVDYYDDNYSSAYSALDVAIKTFENKPTFLIAGGKDRGLDLNNVKNRLKTAPNLQKIFLIGETSQKLAASLPPEKYELHSTLKSAVLSAKIAAEIAAKNQPANTSTKNQPANAVVLMSPGAASFDMFKNFSDRGNQFQQIVQELK